MRTRALNNNNVVFFKSIGTTISDIPGHVSDFVIPDEPHPELYDGYSDFHSLCMFHILETTSTRTIYVNALGEFYHSNIGSTGVSQYQYGTVDRGILIYIKDKAKFLIGNPLSILVDSNFSERQQGVADSLTQRLSVIKNELWYNYNYGLPLLDKGATKAMFDAKIAQIVESHPDVEEIIRLESKVENRKYSANIEVRSIYGNLSVTI